MGFRTVGRREIVNLGPLAPWGSAGAPPMVYGRAAIDAEPGTWAIGVRVGAQTFPRLRLCDNNPDQQYEPLHVLIRRTAEAVGTGEPFHLVYGDESP